MLKIDPREFKDIHYEVKFLIDDSNKYNMNFNQNTQLYMVNLIKTHSKSKDTWVKIEKEIEKQDNCLSSEERLNILMMLNNLHRFMNSKVDIDKHITIDELNEKYKQLNNNGGLSPFFAKLLEIYVQEKNNIVNVVLDHQKQDKLSEYLDTLTSGEKEELKRLMGFEKIPVYIHPTDFSNYAQVSEKYMHQLTDEEIKIDSEINESIEKEKRTKESVEGTTLYKRILDESYDFFKFNRYALGLMIFETESKFDEFFDKQLDEIKSGETKTSQSNYRAIASEAKENLENLQSLTDKIIDTVIEVRANEEKLLKIFSLDDLKKFSNSLSNDSFWFKKAISNVITSMNKRITEFNESVTNGTQFEILSKMSLWQKYELILLRKLPTSDGYVYDEKLVDFSLETLKCLNEYIKQDELKEAQQNGFETYDEYMLSYYEEKTKDKKVVNFKDIRTVLYYRDRLSQNNNRPKKR